MDTDSYSERVALLTTPEAPEPDDLETLDAVAKSRSIYIEPENGTGDVEFHQALAFRTVINNSTAYCVVLFVIGAFVILGATILGLVLAPAQRIPLKGYRVTTEARGKSEWWRNAEYTADWVITSAKGVTPIQLDNTTALWIFGETTYQCTGADKKCTNVTLQSSAMFLSLDKDTRAVQNAYWLRDDAGYPRPIIAAPHEDAVIIPAAPVVVNEVLYQYYRSSNRSSMSYVAAGMAFDQSEDPFVDLEPAFPPVMNKVAPTAAIWAPLEDKNHVYYFFARQDPQALSSTVLNVARLPVSQLLNSTMPFEYWGGGDQWGTPTPAVTLDSIGNSFSVSWNEYAKVYLTLDTGPLVRVVLRSSLSPYKDFTLPMTLYPNITSTEPLSTAQWHPELFEQGGKVMYASVYNGNTPYPTLLRIELIPENQ